MPVHESTRHCAAFAAALACACVLVSGTASAHAVGLSRGEYAAVDRAVTADVTLARADAETFASADELARAIIVSMASADCHAVEARFVPALPDGLTMHARYECPVAAAKARVDAAFVTELPFGHRHLARATSRHRDALDEVLERNHHAFAFAAAGPADRELANDPAAAAAPPDRQLANDSASVSEPRSISLASALSMVRMGVEHILTGYDHLLFLLGLVLACGSVRALLGAVTAFTAAHSITLAVSTLGLWTPPPSVIEPLIAASIAYVGVENLVAPAPRGRWRLTFPFGLVHGFGFAGALREVHFAHASLPLVLGTFNAGVEIGQLAVMAAMVPFIFAMRRRSWLGGRGAIALNGAVAVAGLAWTAVRVLGEVT